MPVTFSTLPPLRLSSCVRIGVLSILLTSQFSLFTWAQHWEFGAGVGGALYKGDLAPTFNPLYTKPGGELFVKYNKSYATAFRFQALYSGLKATSADSPDPYMNTLAVNGFSTPIFEVAAGLEYNFLNYRDPLMKRERGTPYLFMGLGLFYFQPGNVEGIRVSSLQPCIPIGFGYKYRLDKNFNLAAEFAARATFTDLLDDVSNTDGKTGWQRGWQYTNDWYCYFGIKLSYTVYTIICPFDYNR